MYFGFWTDICIRFNISDHSLVILQCRVRINASRFANRDAFFKVCNAKSTKTNKIAMQVLYAYFSRIFRVCYTYCMLCILFAYVTHIVSGVYCVYSSCILCVFFVYVVRILRV